MKRTGTAAVEFALVAPLFTLMLLGMLEFGQAIRVQQVLTNAAREGVRERVTAEGTDVSVEESIQYYWVKSGMKSAPVVNVSSATVGTTTAYTVTTSIPFREVAFAPPFFLKNDLRASCTFRGERTP